MSSEIHLDPALQAFKTWAHAEAQAQTVRATPELLQLKAELVHQEAGRERSKRIERWVMAGAVLSLLSALAAFHAQASASFAPAVLGGLGTLIPICAAASFLTLTTAWLLES